MILTFLPFIKHIKSHNFLSLKSPKSLTPFFFNSSSALISLYSASGDSSLITIPLTLSFINSTAFS